MSAAASPRRLRRPLAAAHPEIAAQLHPTRNGSLDGWTIGSSARTAVWWRCAKGHEWQQAPRVRVVAFSRARGVRCPRCGSLAGAYPDLAGQLDTLHNEGVDPWRVSRASGRKLWWRCSESHRWAESVANRAKGCGCPYCSGRRSAIDHRAFANPTLQAWYWMGFLGADGCVSDSADVTLRLGARDLEHVKAFRRFVGGGERRIYGPTRGCYALTFRSRPIARDLQRCAGITPRKTLTYDCGPMAASRPAFWLGLLDGDGTAYWHTDRRHPGRPRPELRWHGARPVMERCATFWATELGLERVPTVREMKTDGASLYAVALTGGRAASAAALMLTWRVGSLARKRPLLASIALASTEAAA
jgi:hypothetical protein